MPFFQEDRYCVPRSPASPKWFWHPERPDAGMAVSEVSISVIRSIQPDGSHPASAPGKKGRSIALRFREGGRRNDGRTVNTCNFSSAVVVIGSEPSQLVRNNNMRAWNSGHRSGGLRQPPGPPLSQRQRAHAPGSFADHHPRPTGATDTTAGMKEFPARYGVLRKHARSRRRPLAAGTRARPRVQQERP